MVFSFVFISHLTTTLIDGTVPVLEGLRPFIWLCIPVRLFG